MLCRWNRQWKHRSRANRFAKHVNRVKSVSRANRVNHASNVNRVKTRRLAPTVTATKSAAHRSSSPASSDLSLNRRPPLRPLKHLPQQPCRASSRSSFR